MQTNPHLGNLTIREEQIVKLIIKEHSTAQIAADLTISNRTVETHRKNIQRKIGCKSLLCLFSYAIRKGWIKNYYYIKQE
ncbi:MAG: LuxR C-terminal-related transcriptional regulator [Bacteroidota bacterium]|nr:LuxR C-terminal-related transcriptional regulator [Bacteroidota bacterium]